MSRVSIWLAAMTIGIITWGQSVSTLAQSQRCPKGYSLVGSVCVNADGDVVKPQ